MLAASTGLAAFWQASRQPEDRNWAIVLAVVTMIGVLGTVVSLVLFRDRPDQLVATATVLMALVAITALAYSFRPSKRA